MCSWACRLGPTVGIGSVVMLLVGCVGGAEDVEDLEAREEPVILSSSPQWRPILEVARDPTWRRASSYARAVVKVSQAGGMDCSGAMVSDSLFMTAHHCLPVIANPVLLRFGHIGSDYLTQDVAVIMARMRLRQLGVPLAAERSIGNSSIVFQTNAFRRMQEPGRDVVLAEANPLVVTIRLDDGGTLPVMIPMGDIWGRVPLRDFNPSSGRPAYALSVNTVCDSQVRQVLLSPGETRPGTGCLSGYSACFDTTADGIAGSSGGPFFDRTFEQVIGVNSAEPFAGNACQVSGSSQNNTIARLGPTVIAATASRPASGWPDSLVVSPSPPRIGGTGGVLWDEPCPPGMLVRGLIGSTAPNTHYVGNLAIVCQPYSLPGRRGLHSAVVFSPGSQDTGFTVARGEPFHDYLARTRTSTWEAEGLQTLALCPPEFFLRGVQAKSASYVNRIVGLECVHYGDLRRTLTIPLSQDIGYIGISQDGQASTSRCGTGAYVSGMSIRAGWNTDGFQLYCRTLPR